jgi:CheY-like chemotaxis protein
MRHGQRVLLVVEDDPDTSALLDMYFAGLDYQVALAQRGDEALAATRRLLPDLVLLDIGLPDMDGFAVCAALRASPRTSAIPIIFLSERASLRERVAGLEAGAQDYLTKPFDLEELRLRVQNLVARVARENPVDPRSGLPTGAWVSEQAARVAGQPGWRRLECRLEAFQPFVDQNGFVAGDEVLQFAGRLVREVVAECGGPEDFVGHPAHDTFVILTAIGNAPALAERLRARFDAEVQAHYSFLDREQGYVELRAADGQAARAPLMTLAVTLAEAPDGGNP